MHCKLFTVRFVCDLHIHSSIRLYRETQWRHFESRRIRTKTFVEYSLQSIGKDGWAVWTMILIKRGDCEIRLMKSMEEEYTYCFDRKKLGNWRWRWLEKIFNVTVLTCNNVLILNLLVIKANLGIGEYLTKDKRKKNEETESRQMHVVPVTRRLTHSIHSHWSP